MALPRDHDIQMQLLVLLADAPHGRMHCQDVYALLAERFPELDDEDVSIRFANSISHWANRVQFARLHLLLQGYLLPTYLSGWAAWAISEAGRSYVNDTRRTANML